MTKDGRQCASAFAFNGKVFNDCTNTMSPDNKNTGDEWCYVDSNAGGSPNWGYCNPILDYDGVRRLTQNHYYKMTVEARKVVHLVYEQIVPTGKLIQMVKQIGKNQLEVDQKVNVIQAQITKLTDNYDILEKLKKQYLDLEEDIKVLKQEVDKLEAKKEAIGDKDPFNCDGMLGYENESPGDGINAFYYDNEDFIGDPKVIKKDNQVDFSWDNEEPAVGINQDNFSIRWKFWLRVPVKGKYNFYSESDDGHQLKLNGKPIIKHFWGQTGKSGGNWLESHIGNLRKNIKPGIIETNQEAGTISAQSFPISLEGGSKYKVEFEMYHSVHNEENDSAASFSRLYWENEFMQKEVIRQDFLYTENKIVPLKLSAWDPRLCDITSLQENDDAFFKSKTYKIQDIPFAFQGAAGLKLVREWPLDSFDFEVNGAIILYFAVPFDNNPLPEDFKFTTEVISVLKINAKDKPINNKLKAIQSVCFFIYKKKFKIGRHSVKLQSDKSQLILFYTPDPGASSQLTCGGEEEQISLPSCVGYQSCSESSRLNNNGWSCIQGFSGINEDSETGTWATDNSGVGSSITLKLKVPYQISKVQIKNRSNMVERNSKIEIQFDGGDIRTVDLKNLDSIQTYQMDPQPVSKTITFTIKKVYSQGNNGGSFNVFGTACIDPKSLEEGEPIKEEKEMSIECGDTLITDKFDPLALKDGSQLIITCIQSCKDSKDQVYGDLKYSEDSGICRSAFHQGALSEKGGKCIMIIESGLNEYKGSFRSGVQSKSKQGNSILTMRFERMGDQVDIQDLLKVGMKVDIFDDGLKKWLPGVIKEFERINAETAKLKVAKEGMPDSSQEKVVWPQFDKVDYCSKKIPKRDCGNDAPAKPKSLNIAFVATEPPQGYLADKGEQYTKHDDYEYGWSQDATKNMRMRNEAEGVENQLALFPPYSKSIYCSEDPPRMSCSPNFWKIKMKPGLYNVKLVVGDPTFQSQYDLQVNGINFLVGKVLKKDQFTVESRQIKVEVTDPFLKVTNDCKAENCQYSWSRVSAILIEELQEEIEDPNEDTQKLGCGEAYIKGRCNRKGEDVENCIYQLNEPGQNNCYGPYDLVMVDKGYFCKDQIGKAKCILTKFKDQKDCEKKCPGKCNGVKCKAEPPELTKWK